MSVSSATFEFLMQLLHDQSSIVLDSGKEYLLESRLAPLLGAEGLASLDELAQTLRRDRHSPLHRRLVEAMTNNETWFFRDGYPFEALRQVILPGLLRRHKPECELSVWSAGCSSGQEIYSVAMLVREHCPRLLTGKLNLLGTDISHVILHRARLARYSQWEVNRGLPPGLLCKYFTRSATDWELAAKIKDTVSFRFMNLAAPWPPMETFDVIFLRNVLIYLSLDSRKKILAKLRQLLRPGGYLFGICGVNHESGCGLPAGSFPGWLLLSSRLKRLLFPFHYTRGRSALPRTQSQKRSRHNLP
jgi:chemotaxis protein methyltransferase CheR